MSVSSCIIVHGKEQLATREREGRKGRRGSRKVCDGGSSVLHLGLYAMMGDA